MYWKLQGAPTRVEFLFQVLLGIGMLFRVGTPYSRVSLRITSCSCEGETQIWRRMFVNEPQLRGHGGKIHFVSVLFVGMTFGDVQV